MGFGSLHCVDLEPCRLGAALVVRALCLGSKVSWVGVLPTAKTVLSWGSLNCLKCTCLASCVTPSDCVAGLCVHSNDYISRELSRVLAHDVQDTYHINSVARSRESHVGIRNLLVYT